MELETADPIAALKAKSIHERCSGCRDLSKMGDLDALPVLADRAANDKSPAVRLCSAGAASDILSRYRLAPHRDGLDNAARMRILDLFKVIDPAVNAGLFSMLACLDLPLSFSRIATGLRDPRGDVRVGAGVGLMRLCISVARLGDVDLEKSVVELLNDKRIKPDALGEIARVCAAAGYRSAASLLRDLDMGESGQAGLVIEMADVLDTLAEPISGLWASDGLDAGEVRGQGALPPAVLAALGDGAALTHSQGDAGWKSADLLRGVGPGAGGRRMYFRRVGEATPTHALQTRGRTWYPVDMAEPFDLLDEPGALDVQAIAWGAEAPAQQADVDLAEGLLPALGEGAGEARLAALVLARAGRPAEALAALEAAAAQKKAAADLWFFLGEARAAAGDAAGATAAYEAANRKAKRKKDWFAVAARARLGL